MLSAIAAFAAIIGQQQNQPPPPPVLPPFTGSGAATDFGGKSLPALFPSVDPKVILEIAAHTFSPLDLPRLLSPLAARQDYIAPPSSAPATEHVLALKHFPSFHSLIRPLLKYFEILSAFAASSGKAWEVFAITRSLSDYISHLTELHQRYKWSAVIIYHVEFHTVRLWEMKAGTYSGWAHADLDLLSRLVYPHPLPPPSSPSQLSSRSASTKSKKSSLPVEQQICFDWNTGVCKTTPCPTKRRHVCRACEGDHQSTACTRKN
ncbi:hypothetical protein GGX14DRAFT_372039 [Mycena pura]|uniref:Uncharacterized protein n=1 Tax=Mycena pura TaxID=153505 RepID=A0AAD6Y9E6_9AGAR|nr:hypothetical protein GGX14DRAFT_372039 [Mycena pura]